MKKNEDGTVIAATATVAVIVLFVVFGGMAILGLTLLASLITMWVSNDLITVVRAGVMAILSALTLLSWYIIGKIAEAK